jgi:hypothetical protein
MRARRNQTRVASAPASALRSDSHQAQIGLDVARAVLGHSSPVVTEVYAEPDQANAIDAMGKIG